MVTTTVIYPHNGIYAPNLVTISIGALLGLPCVWPISFRRSSLYFCCFIKYPYVDCVISMPKKYVSGPCLVTSKCVSSALPALGFICHCFL